MTKSSVELDRRINFFLSILKIHVLNEIGYPKIIYLIYIDLAFNKRHWVYNKNIIRSLYILFLKKKIMIIYRF